MKAVELFEKKTSINADWFLLQILEHLGLHTDDSALSDTKDSLTVFMDSDCVRHGTMLITKDAISIVKKK